MQAEWRLLQDDIHEARHHFAVEEAIARLIDKGHSPPTLRLRRVHPAVFIGVNQNTWSEVDVDYCRTHDIQIVRRMNGGGAIYQEMGSFCYSAFFPRKLFNQCDEELYRLFADPIICTCLDYGVNAHYEGRNDVMVRNRKIYGSAQFSYYQAFVQSGTFLVNINFDTMARVLTPPALKFSGKPACSVLERVTSLSRELGRELDTCEVMKRFAKNVTRGFGIQFVPGDLTPAEQELAAELLSVKYNTDKWNFGSLLEFQVTVASRTDDGVICLSADVEDGVIQKVSITGDMLYYHRDKMKNLEQRMIGCSIREAQNIVQATTFPDKIHDTLIRLMEKLSQEVSDISSTRLKEEKYE
jgi:lipoate-protein ligase A